MELKATQWSFGESNIQYTMGSNGRRPLQRLRLGLQALGQGASQNVSAAVSKAVYSAFPELQRLNEWDQKSGIERLQRVYGWKGE